jgi:hypothetical protein
MVCDKTFQHPMGDTEKAYEYTTLSYRHNKRPIDLTGGLLAIAELMQSMQLAQHIDMFHAEHYNIFMYL